MIDPRPLFAPLHDGLIELLQVLSDDEWFLPTACEPWTVHDICIHLFGADINVLSGDRDHFAHPLRGGWRDLSDWSDLLAFIDQRNAEWVETNSRISPATLVDLLACTGPLAAHVWDDRDMAAIGRPVDWVGADPQALWVHVAREYTERWVHQQQIRDAVHKPGFAEEWFIRPVIEAFMLALPRALDKVPAGRGDVVRVVLTGDGGGTWIATFDGESWIGTAGPGESEVAAIEMSTDAFWRMASRTISPDEARGRARTIGDATAVDAFVHMVSMIVG